MLLFSGVMCNAVTKFAPRTIWRNKAQQLLTVSSSTATNPEAVPIPNKSEDELRSEKQNHPKVNQKEIKSQLVRMAFASLWDKNKSASSPKTQSMGKEVNLSIGKEIYTAETVDQLLSVTTKGDISQSNALNIMSILSDWTNKKKITLSEFDKDPRFLTLCQRLSGSSMLYNNYKDHKHGDLSTILGLAGDEEAAKLVTTLSLNQMIKVMSTLARKRRRSLSILRSLSFNIGRNLEKLNIKQAADLLYAMAILNYPDEILLEKSSRDLIQRIPENEGSAVIGSIIASLGFLRYKNTELLDALCEWIIAKKRVLRPQNITSLLITLATVNYTPPNIVELHKQLIAPLKETDLPASETWLDIVWAATVLGLTEPHQIASVLDSVFIQKLTDMQCLTLPRKIRLLNINAAARLLVPNYTGPFLLDDSELSTSIMERSKEKQAYVVSVLDTLSNLFPASSCLKNNINTGMGYILDAECCVDANSNPLPIDQLAEKHKDAIRIAVIALHYSDFCRGKEEPLGIYSLLTKLLEAKGYSTVIIPYTEYDAKDKLVIRVKYIEQKIKSLIKPRST